MSKMRTIVSSARSNIANIAIPDRRVWFPELAVRETANDELSDTGHYRMV